VSITSHSTLHYFLFKQCKISLKRYERTLYSLTLSLSLSPIFLVFFFLKLKRISMAVKKLIIVVDITATMESYWNTILEDYLEKIIRFNIFPLFFSHFSLFIYSSSTYSSLFFYMSIFCILLVPLFFLWFCI